MADMNPIMDLAKRYKLYVIEDEYQAIGSKYDGKQAGEFGDFGCFSFFPSKNLGAYGDGGLITVKDPDLAKRQIFYALMVLVLSIIIFMWE